MIDPATPTENVFHELKGYVDFGEADERALRLLHPLALPKLEEISDAFYRQILENDGARKALVGGESRVGQLKVTLLRWMDELLRGPWDEAYYEKRAKIGRVHVRISLPQHYMFGSMNLVRRELNQLADLHFAGDRTTCSAVQMALGKILDLELAIMLHTYREDLLSQQARAERLATYGQLVGSIGHELRNPLGVIETSLYILRSRPVAEDEKASKHLHRIGEQVSIANGIITNLLDMIRDVPLIRESVELAKVWETVRHALPVPSGISVVTRGLEELPSIQADAGQIRQVLLNLFENAVQAVGEAGEIRVEAEAAEGWLQVAIEDSGPGLSPAIEKRLFEPLMTTRPGGIGLGLPLVKRIIERHGGTIAHAPRPGSGARFVLRLRRQS